MPEAVKHRFLCIAVNHFSADICRFRDEAGALFLQFRKSDRIGIDIFDTLPALNGGKNVPFGIRAIFLEGIIRRRERHKKLCDR